jgi:Txe/YoeB family toxin of Txe-Axe toxin-antitoxin module
MEETIMGWTALIDKDFNEIGYTGDDPWDILDDAVEELQGAYQKYWKRKMNAEEIAYSVEYLKERLERNENGEEEDNSGS